MVHSLIVQIALIIVIIRCGYLAVTLAQRAHKAWLDILFYTAAVVLALSYLF